jgi:acetyltransferase-like isoleucine patch superfamily enzyme
VAIGSDVYIGANAILLPGVTVGDGCVVGAGAVVTTDVAPMKIVAGNPARVIGDRDPEELARTRECLEKGLPVGHVPREQ